MISQFVKRRSFAGNFTEHFYPKVKYITSKKWESKTHYSMETLHALDSRSQKREKESFKVEATKRGGDHIGKQLSLGGIDNFKEHVPVLK